MKYTDYCTTFYDPKSDTVHFYDEIRNRTIYEQKVSGKVEANIVMRIWKDDAPEGCICEILED